jgi:glutathione S-transferase
MTTPVRLYVLPPSHFCERARWGLDHVGVRYVEEAWAVGPHLVRARRVAPKTSLPILLAGAQIIQGSGHILDWAGLATKDADVERRFVIKIGPLVRRYIYSATLTDPASNMREILLSGVPRVQGALGRLMWPITRRLMISAMDARPERLAELETRLSAELDWFDILVEERRYLVGSTFGRTDITAASLLAPLARPIACPLYQKGVLPPRLEDTLARWSERPSLRWVEQVYTRHRHCADR